MNEPKEVPLNAPEAFFNRELSWLAFVRRVLSRVQDESLPLLERLKFAGITAMLHEEFFMKRISGLKRQISHGSRKLSLDGRTPSEEFQVCREELLAQDDILTHALHDSLLPQLAAAGHPILDYDSLDEQQKMHMREYFHGSVQPLLTPLAVDVEHPFPFISSLSSNLAVRVPADGNGTTRFVRIKVPNNRPRWVPLPEHDGFVPLEQVIAANLDLMFPHTPPREVYLFRVVRGASSDMEGADDSEEKEVFREPGSIVDVVASELKARRFAGVVRVQVSADMPTDLIGWLTGQLGANDADVYRTRRLVGLSDLLHLDLGKRDDLQHPKHRPKVHPRLRRLDPHPESIFKEIAAGDILLHHPYQGFDTSVMRFLESAVLDPQVLAIKLTIYRTGAESPIIKMLADAAHRGKQVAVVVEITARFDEAPNIEWGRYLEKEGVHVAYGVERLKTHVKLAMVVRQEGEKVRRYAHIGTGNYNATTARVYEDLGLLTCHAGICRDVAAVFNSLTGAYHEVEYQTMLVAPRNMRARFVELIRREADHAANGRPAGIYAKMNQLQDPDIIRELYRAGRAGVPIRLNVRGTCCLRPGVEGLSENIRCYALVGRFLEHSRLYRFANGGEPDYYLGSADWMKRNLNSRVETIVPVLDPKARRDLDRIIGTYEQDNSSVWDCLPDGSYELRRPRPGDPVRAAQEIFSGAPAAEPVLSPATLPVTASHAEWE